MIQRPVDAAITPELISGAVTEFMREVRPRLQRLRDYYDGNSAIKQRVRAPGLPNNRLSHAFPRYITTMASGYLAGQPVKYSMAEGEDAKSDAALEALAEAYRLSDMDSVDNELAKDASIYGKGVCICYVSSTRGTRPMATTIDPRSAFVIYDDTVEHQPMAGVHIYPHIGADGHRSGINVDAYTRTSCISFTRGTDAGAMEQRETRPHFFGGVPIIEVWNNSDETGDYEAVIPLIDAYDAVESDRVNDKQQFTDAILLLTGCMIEGDMELDADGNPKDTRTPAQKLMEEKTLSLPDSEAKAEWLVKQSDEAGTEILKNAIKADIHKMSMVPDLTDEHFAGNVSGVAMRYKLLGLEQMTATKERWFSEGIRSRLRLFGNVLRELDGVTIDADAVTITFTRSLPVNEAETASMVATLDGMVPSEILMAQLPFVKDVEDAMDKLRAQKEEAARTQAEAFGSYTDANERSDEEKGAEKDTDA